jgi:phospholipase C
VPIISTLAQEFGFFDGWHASVPGPTLVNRAYASSATSNGMGTNDELTIAKGMPQKTMFRQLVEMGHDYSVYYSDIPTVLMFKDMRHKEARGNPIDRYAISVT